MHQPGKHPGQLKEVGNELHHPVIRRRIPLFAADIQRPGSSGAGITTW